VVVDEFGEDEDGGDEGELGVAVFGAAVGVSAHLAVVGEPRVGALHGPSFLLELQWRDRQIGSAGCLFAGDARVGQAALGELGSHVAVVEPAVQMEPVDPLDELGGDTVDGRWEQDAVLSVGPL
jgi:hypothetical protein